MDAVHTQCRRPTLPPTLAHGHLAQPGVCGERALPPPHLAGRDNVVLLVVPEDDENQPVGVGHLGRGTNMCACVWPHLASQWPCAVRVCQRACACARVRVCACACVSVFTCTCTRMRHARAPRCNRDGRPREHAVGGAGRGGRAGAAAQRRSLYTLQREARLGSRRPTAKRPPGRGEREIIVHLCDWRRRLHPVAETEPPLPEPLQGHDRLEIAPLRRAVLVPPVVDRATEPVRHEHHPGAGATPPQAEAQPVWRAWSGLASASESRKPPPRGL